MLNKRQRQRLINRFFNQPWVWTTLQWSAIITGMLLISACTFLTLVLLMVITNMLTSGYQSILLYRLLSSIFIALGFGISGYWLLDMGVSYFSKFHTNIGLFGYWQGRKYCNRKNLNRVIDKYSDALLSGDEDEYFENVALLAKEYYDEDHIGE